MIFQIHAENVLQLDCFDTHLIAKAEERCPLVQVDGLVLFLLLQETASNELMHELQRLSGF